MVNWARVSRLTFGAGLENARLSVHQRLHGESLASVQLCSLLSIRHTLSLKLAHHDLGQGRSHIKAATGRESALGGEGKSVW